MAEQAKSAFTVQPDEGVDLPWEGGTMNRGRWRKTYTGDLTATATAELTFLQVEGGAAAYVGIERVDGTLGGRTGAFVLTHSASMLGDSGHGSWRIVAGSGTGELVGIRGSAEILPDHELVVDYTFEG